MANLDDSEVVIRHQADRDAEIADNDGDRFEEALAHPDRDDEHVNDTSVSHDEVADMIRREIREAMGFIKDQIKDAVQVQFSELGRNQGDNAYMLGRNSNQNQAAFSELRGGPGLRMSSPFVPGGSSGDRVKIKPQTYDGSEDLSEYVTHFNLVAELNGWSYGVKSLHLASCLTGDARTLLNDLDARKQRDYNALLEALNHRFGTENRAEIFKSQLKMRVRGKSETLPELAQSIRKLAKRAYPDASASILEVLALDHFIDAINETEIRMRLREVSPTNILEAEQIAVKLEAYKEADKDRRKTVRACVGGSETTLGDLSDEISKLQHEIRNMKHGNSNQGGYRPRYNNNRPGNRQQGQQRRMDPNGQNNAGTSRDQGNGGRSQLGGAARQGQRGSPMYC